MSLDHDGTLAEPKSFLMVLVLGPAVILKADYWHMLLGWNELSDSLDFIPDCSLALIDSSPAVRG